MSTRLDEQLRDGLRDLAEGVHPRPSDEALRMMERRVTERDHGRDRRQALVVFVLLLLGAVAFGFAAKVFDDRPTQVRSATPPSPPDVPQCSIGSQLPCDPGDGNLQITEKVVVADGDHNGIHWQLLAYLSDAGLCLDFAVSSSSSGGCGAGVPPRVMSLGDSRVVGFGRSADGFVRKDVARVRLELTDGTAIEVEPVGESAGFEANFFVAILPDDVSVVRGVAYGFDGVELARQEPGTVERPPLFDTDASEPATTTATSPPSAAPPRCNGGGGVALSVGLTPTGDDVTGTATITNRNNDPQAACTVSGAPAVFIQPGSGAPLVQPAQLPTPGGETITLHPGESASVTFVWSNWCSQDRPIGRITLRLFPDGGNGQLHRCTRRGCCARVFGHDCHVLGRRGAVCGQAIA